MFKNRVYTCVLIGVAFAFGSPTSPVHAQDERTTADRVAAPADDPPDREWFPLPPEQNAKPGDSLLRKKQVERYNAARLKVDALRAHYEHGLIPADEFLRGIAGLGEVAASLHDTGTEVVEARKRQLAMTTAVERRELATYEAGTGSLPRFLQAREARLGSEVALLQAHAQAGQPQSLPELPPELQRTIEEILEGRHD